MSLLAKVTTGKMKLPYFVAIYGSDGIGKTTFAASAPTPLIIGAEKGSSNLDVARIEVASFKEVLQVLDELLKNDHDYQTLAIDSLDWLEPLIWEELCKEYDVPNIERVEGGYYKGYRVVLAKWKVLFQKLDQLRIRKKMNLILIAHAESKKFIDSEHGVEYKKVQLKLHEFAAAVVREAVDAVLYATNETHFKRDEGTKKIRAFGEGVRVVYTEMRPTFDAKNRLGLPFTMPLSWEEFESAANKGEPDAPEAIRQRMKGMLSLFNSKEDKAFVGKVEASIEKAGDDAKKLSHYENLLKTRIGEKEGDPTNA